MTVKLYDLSMKEIHLRGVRWLEFTPEPSTVERESERVYNGEITLGRTRNPVYIRTRFLYESENYHDYKKLRDEISFLLSPLRDIYAVDGDVPGKRWKVERESMEIERINGRVAEVAVLFYCGKGLSESVGLSTEEYEGKMYMWRYFVGDIGDSLPWRYTHTTPTFSIFNGGTEKVDPREHELNITITSKGGTSSAVTLRNLSTGELWKYTGTFSNNNVIRLNGVKMTRNNLNIVGSTNLGLITLQSGLNNFSVEGISGAFEVSVSFRYLYA